MKIPMTALRAFPYARRDLSKGQEFEAENALDAHVLQTVGHAEMRSAQTYETRVMTAIPPGFRRVTHSPIAGPTVTRLEGDFDSMDAAALRALAARLGIKVHHRTGAEKLRQILKASA